MPSRLVCVAILLYWAVATFGLVRRDLIPEFNSSPPPDLLSIAVAEEKSGSSRWALQVIDADSPEDFRNVGQATTSTVRGPDGWIEMASVVWLDSGRMIRGVPLPHRGDDRIAFDSKFRIDPSGNLRTFQVAVRSEADQVDVLKIEGRLEKGEMLVSARGPMPMFNRKFAFPYRERGVVGSKFGPLDRLPGLRVGQRWEERVANPLTGQVETVKVQVARKVVIQWNGSPVETKEVTHQSASLSVRTWVRHDGVVLRQEVPFPLLKMVLERQDDPVAADPPG